MSKTKNNQAPAEQATIQNPVDGEHIVREVMAPLPAADPVQIPAQNKPHIPLTHRTWAKTLIFILTLLMAAVTVLSAIGAVFLVSEDVYTTPQAEFHAAAFRDLAENAAYNTLFLVVHDQEYEAEDYLHFKNVSGISIIAEGEQELHWDYRKNAVAGNTEVYETRWYLNKNGFIHSAQQFNSADDLSSTIYVNVYVPTELTEQDDFMLADFAINTMYALRYWIFAIAAAGLLLTILCFVFLMCASGRRGGLDEPQPGWGTWIPFDVLTAVLFSALLIILHFVDEAFCFHSAAKQIIVLSVCGLSAAVMFLGWCMSAAVRLKLGSWWKKLAIVWVILGMIRLLELTVRLIWRILRGCGRMILALFKAIPLVWKTLTVCAAILFMDFLSTLMFRRDTDILVITWILLHSAVFLLVLYIAANLRRLQKGGEALASGDLTYQVDTRWMLPDFKTHAENLGNISKGMTAAVEQRLKSERMKTELITNVSHDIKTPLTSIINYSDLIEKEPCENEKISEYAAVLHRQSERLKRLIDDLVEASKASTGNLDVLLAPCEVGVMLSQTVGEYEQRLEQCKLTLVTKQPEQPVRIMADGRRIWRVFDNLMNNICKYAMPGTRVYLTLEETDSAAVISFKNTSREPLDLSADELMERFVRGDAARSSEGNGLGLSIAKSLVQLQNGTLELTVDGDLFKAVLSFPTIG